MNLSNLPLKLQENNPKKKNYNQQKTFSDFKIKLKKLGVKVTKDRLRYVAECKKKKRKIVRWEPEIERETLVWKKNEGC